MLKNKPYIIFLWISILSLILLATKFLTWETKATDSTYWFFVLRDGLPYIVGVSLLFAVLYWLMFKFKRPTHPILNIVQLLTLMISYVGFSFMMGVIIRTGDSLIGKETMPTELVTLNYIFMISMIATFVILALNIILSIAKPNIGRKEITSIE